METEDRMVENTWVEQNLDRWGYESPYLIGQGAFARVYRVRQRGTGSFFACKISGEKGMLRREAKLLRQIEHPLFPRFHDIREQGGSIFLFMEYVAGVNLETLVRRRGRMSERQVVRIGMELAEGLCYLHERNAPILFRDVKPGNIMIGQNGKIRLLDFGSAGWGGEPACVITGTKGYSAPEQWEEPEKAGPYSDVYGVGAVMYYVLTGRIPDYCRENVSNRGKREKKRNGRTEAVIPRRVHWGVIQLIEACLQVRAEERIPDMRYLMHRLRPYQKAGRWEVLWIEVKAWYQGRRENRYIFQKNILKTSI